MSQITDYETLSDTLIPAQLKKQYGPDSSGGGSGGGSTPGQGQTFVVTFPRYSYLSNVVPFAITDVARLCVEWGPKQENKGQLIYGHEFTVSGNKIQLTNGTGGTVDWTPTVQANALGLLNLTVTQET
jgi:hypothetical protein